MSLYQNPDHGTTSRRNVVIRTPKSGDKRAAKAKHVPLKVNGRWSTDAVRAIVNLIGLGIFWACGLIGGAYVSAVVVAFFATRAVLRADVRGQYNSWRYGHMLAKGRITVTYVAPETVAAFDVAAEKHKLGELGVSSEDVMQEYPADVLDMQHTATIVQHSTDEGNREVAQQVLAARANRLCKAIREGRQLLVDDAQTERQLSVYRERQLLEQELAVYTDESDDSNS